MDSESAQVLLRVQVAMWIGDNWCRCAICGHVYESVDDFLERNPIELGKDDRDLMVIADQACFERVIDEYRARHSDVATR